MAGKEILNKRIIDKYWSGELTPKQCIAALLVLIESGDIDLSQHKIPNNAKQKDFEWEDLSRSVNSFTAVQL